MSNIRVLFITNYFTSGNPNNTPSNEVQNHFRSIMKCSQINSGFFCYDAGILGEYGEDVLTIKHTSVNDKVLLERCLDESVRPDVIFYMESLRGTPGPDYVTLACIRRTLNIPVVMFWADAEGDDITRMEQMYPFVDKHILLDGFDPTRFTRMPERYIRTFPPQDPDVVYNDNRERDILVSFPGQVPGQGRRNEYIEALEKAGVPLCVMGGRSWDKGDDDIPVEEFFNLHRRSMIVLNFVGRENTHTARTMEATLCGALVMEPANSYHLPFADFVDIVPFSNEGELIERVKYFLVNKAEACRIALSGHRKAVSINEKYLETILASIGVNVNVIS